LRKIKTTQRIHNCDIDKKNNFILQRIKTKRVVESLLIYIYIKLKKTVKGENKNILKIHSYRVKLSDIDTLYQIERN